MGDDLSVIIGLVAPPRAPVGLDRSWDDVEHELGVSLPADYMEFIDTYGSGVVADSLSIWNFRDRVLFNRPLGETLLGKGGVIPLYRHVASMGNDVPFALYPEPGGLLPFGACNEVHNLNWETTGEPDSWSIVYWYSDGLEFLRLDGDGFSRFLRRVIRREHSRYELPKLDPPWAFKPARR